MNKLQVRFMSLMIQMAEITMYATVYPKEPNDAINQTVESYHRENLKFIKDLAEKHEALYPEDFKVDDLN